jgi:hypothetical protein
MSAGNRADTEVGSSPSGVLESERALWRSPFAGPLFEGFVASEIAKLALGLGRPRELYYFRDQQGLEVDFVVPAGHRRLALVEAKASRTARPEMAEPLDRLARAVRGYDVRRRVVHRPTKETRGLSALRPGVRAYGVEDLLAELRGGPTERVVA